MLRKQLDVADMACFVVESEGVATLCLDLLSTSEHRVPYSGCILVRSQLSFVFECLIPRAVIRQFYSAEQTDVRRVALASASREFTFSLRWKVDD